MPLFDFLCENCGKYSELLITGTDEETKCKFCGSRRLNKQVSAHSSMSGIGNNKMPGSGDTACCGSSPNEASCAGPGSCCGKNI